MKFFFFWFFSSFFLFASEGLEYTHLKVPTSFYFNFITGNQSIHLIEIDPVLYEIKPIKALDDGIGRETVLSISSRYAAVASINGGFFSIGGALDGKACGALKIDDWYALATKPRGCIGWSQKDQRPKMDRLLIKASVNYEFDKIPIDGLNEKRNTGEIILFTPCFHKTTLTKPDGQELVVIDGIIREINSTGSSKIPENGFILSIQKQSPFYDAFQKGKPIEFSIDVQPIEKSTCVDEWQLCDYIVGGCPLLLHDNSKVLNFDAEQTIDTFLSNKHARTAIGILPNGHWLFVVVDKTNLFDGMTMYELSDFMAELGCMHALNLDGGGSSTMVFKGNVANNPYGDEEESLGKKMVRRVSDAIIVIPKK